MSFKISGMIIGTLLISIFVVYYTVMLNEANNNYDVTLSNETLAKLEQFDEHSEALARVNHTTQSLTGEKQGFNAVDLLGGLFTSGYNAFLTAKDSVATVTTVTTQGVDELHLGSEMTNIVKTVIIGILIVLFLFTLIGILIRNEDL